jgi:hypothetical protein
MSAERQQRKPGGMRFLAKIAVALLLASLPPVLASRAATTERIVVDPNRGLALSGFDPVAYFTDAKPLMGREDLEYRFGGAIWRFRNEGNLAAFAKNPEIYFPAFGGYDPVAVVRGVATPGHPEIWLITGQRLYLFYDTEARRKFSAAPQTEAAEAEKKWPDVLLTISP